MQAARFWDHDVAWSFRRSPVTVVAALLTLACVGGALLAPWIAPQDPFDLAALDLNEAFQPPAWSEGGKPAYLLGTDNQGRDILSTIMHGARISLGIGFAAVAFAMVLGVALGLVAGYFGGKLDAFIMRIADVQLSFPAILIALLIDGVARVALGGERHEEIVVPVLVLSIGFAGWVQYARTVRGSTMVEREKEYVQAARVIGRRPLAILLAHVLPNVHGAGAGDRHHPHRHGDHHRGDALLPRRRRAADAALARHADPRGQRVPLFGRVVDHGVPRRRAGDPGALGQPARRLAARRAQPEAAMILDVRD